MTNDDFKGSGQKLGRVRPVPLPNWIGFKEGQGPEERSAYVVAWGSYSEISFRAYYLPKAKGNLISNRV
jgi:hypothetical protein